MRKRRTLFIALACAAMAGCVQTERKPAAAAPPVVRGATVAAVSQQSVPDVVEAVGSLKARHQAVISARISGTVSGVFVTEGDLVAAGKTLAKIASVEIGASAAGARAGVGEARGSLEEARARQRLAEAQYRRFSRLYEEQAVTRQEFETRRMEQETAAEAVAKAESRVAQAREGASSAGAVAEYGVVAAPFSGLVVAKQVEAGQTVFPGAPLFTIEGTDGMRLEVAAPETLLGRVRPGDLVSLELQGAPLTGKVAQLIPVVDQATRTFVVKIEVPGAPRRSGAYGKALFPVGTRQVVTVPAGALVARGSLTSVWAVSPEGIARMRLVKPGRRHGAAVEILSGVDSGERVVVAGVEKVTDGAKVQ